MYDLDHMLNGKGIREHHQKMIQQAQNDRFAREFKAAKRERKPLLSPRAALATIVAMIARWG
jgi:hypothetical protein